MAALGQMAYTLPLMLLAQQVDWTEPRNLFFGRLGFATAQLLTTLICMFILRVSAKHGGSLGLWCSLNPSTSCPILPHVWVGTCHQPSCLSLCSFMQVIHAWGSS